MNLVFLGDIHAHLAALDAVLADVRRKPTDRIYHLGNVVGLGPQPREVLARLQEEGIDGVRGPHDERVATGFDVPVGRRADDSEDLARSICVWTRDRLSVRERNDLARLPFMRSVSSGRMTVAFFHAHPVEMTRAATADRPDDFFREMSAYSRARVNVFAHTHRPFWRVVDGDWFVNAGSVGCAAGDGKGVSYARVELNGGAAVRIERVTLDPAPVVAAVAEAGLDPGVLRLLGVD